MGDTNFVNMPALGVLGGSPSIAGHDLQPVPEPCPEPELSALESSNRGKVIQSPRVTAMDQTKAEVARASRCLISFHQQRRHGGGVQRTPR